MEQNLVMTQTRLCILKYWNPDATHTALHKREYLVIIRDNFC